MHSHRLLPPYLWLLATSIVTQLHLIWRLNLFLVSVHPDHNSRSVSKFANQLSSSGWVIARTACSFPDFGDSVVGRANLIVGVHDSTQSKTEPISFRIPPSPAPMPLAAFIWEPFNKSEYSISFAKDDNSFANEANHGMTATVPAPSVMASIPDGLRPLYYLHLRDSNLAILAGAAVCPSRVCVPPLTACQTPMCFVHALELNTMWTVIDASVPFHLLNLRLASDSLTNYGIVCLSA